MTVTPFSLLHGSVAGDWALSSSCRDVVSTLELLKLEPVFRTSRGCVSKSGALNMLYLDILVSRDTTFKSYAVTWGPQVASETGEEINHWGDAL